MTDNSTHNLVTCKRCPLYPFIYTNKNTSCNTGIFLLKHLVIALGQLIDNKSTCIISYMYQLIDHVICLFSMHQTVNICSTVAV